MKLTSANNQSLKEKLRKIWFNAKIRISLIKEISKFAKEKDKPNS